MIDPLWFNLSPPFWRFRRINPDGPYMVKLWNLFNRRQRGDGGGWEWGVGLLQLSHWGHLLYAGSSGLCIAFVWVVGEKDGCIWGRELVR